MKFLLKNVLPKVNADAAKSSLQQKGNSLPRAWGNEKWSFEMATAMVLLDCCSDTKNILHNIQVKKDRRDGKRGGVTKRTPMQSPKCLARKYYEKCHQLRELVNDTTKKQRVEDWDQLLFVKKDDTLEQQNQRNDLIPDDKKMIDDDEKDGGLDFLNSLLAGSQVEDLYNEANAAGQDHRGYQSFTPNWNTKDPNPMPVDGKNPFGGVGGSTFDGHDKYQVMSL